MPWRVVSRTTRQAGSCVQQRDTISSEPFKTLREAKARLCYSVKRAEQQLAGIEAAKREGKSPGQLGIEAARAEDAGRAVFAGGNFGITLIDEQGMPTSTSIEAADVLAWITCRALSAKQSGRPFIAAYAFNLRTKQLTQYVIDAEGVEERH